LAQKFGGEIVNADSVQLYRGFDIGSAKTPAQERQGIPHHLLDVWDAQMISSAGDFARLARATVSEIADRGVLPIVVGGTGFYLRAFLEGLPDLPPRDESLRFRLELREERRPGSLHRLLSRLDRETAARIHPSDVQKLTRALEIRIATGRALPPASEAEPLTGYNVLFLGLDPPREVLVEAIAQRTRQMFAQGLIEEVRALLESGLTGQEKPFETLGYKQALAHVRGQVTLEAAIESTQIETRQYAKRQRTWFRREAQIKWLLGFGSAAGIQTEAEQLARAVL
jgi:tRNA dimethylallyltransferase